MQYDIVRGFFADCKHIGYQFALPGGPEEGEGFVVQPAIVDNPPDKSLVVTGEAFGSLPKFLLGNPLTEQGPIVPLLSWKTESEVYRTASGLGGTVWSADKQQAEKMARRIEAGTVWINSFEKPLPQAFLSGRKESGVGGEWGRHGLLSYCRVQSIHRYKENIGISRPGGIPLED